jgi:hypothetical protein
MSAIATGTIVRMIASFAGKRAISAGPLSASQSYTIVSGRALLT